MAKDDRENHAPKDRLLDQSGHHSAKYDCVADIVEVKPKSAGVFDGHDERPQREAAEGGDAPVQRPCRKSPAESGPRLASISEAEDNVEDSELARDVRDEAGGGCSQEAVEDEEVEGGYQGGHADSPEQNVGKSPIRRMGRCGWIGPLGWPAIGLDAYPPPGHTYTIARFERHGQMGGTEGMGGSP